MKKKYGLLLIIILGLGKSISFAQLPQKHSYQQTLRNYLSSLQKSEFEVTLEPLKVDPTFFSTGDEIYQTWLLFGYHQKEMMNTKGVRVDASHFTLDAIERDGQVNMTVGRNQWMPLIATAFWADWDYEGNPHYNSKAVKLRAFVTAAVDIMMQDQDHAKGNHRRSDYLGLQLIRWAYAYGVAKDILPKKVREAYETGLIKMFERLEEWGPTGTHADMDMGTLVGMLYTAQFIDSPDLTQRAHDHIDLILDKHLFDAGYIDHGSSYDAGYNGMSLYFINWATQISDYPPLIDALKKMSKLKAYLTLPEPDGRRYSPFHTNPSSGGDAPHDYWGGISRDVGIAQYADDGIYLALKGSKRSIFGESAMLQELDEKAGYFNYGENDDHFTASLDASPDGWKHEHWSAHNSINPTSLYYKDGLYDKLKKIQNSGSPLKDPPFLRSSGFTESFADKFLSVKRPNYGTIIFNDRLSWWTEKGQTESLNGFGGGNLSAFWTSETGSVLLGGTRTDHNGGIDLKDWKIWPVHALSGETPNGRAFSSGLQRYPKAVYELDRNPKRVTITGDLTNIYSDPQDGLQGNANYKRVFQIKENGVQVTTSVNADGSNGVNELYEILPVYRRDAKWQSSAKPTYIEFKSNGNWKEAGTNFQKVTSIRLSRFNGQVYIDFKNPVRVKLSPHDFYQNPDEKAGMQARNIMIDLLDNGGESAQLKNTSVSYFMRSSKAAPNDGWSGSEATDDDSSGTNDDTSPKINVTHSPANPSTTEEVILKATASDDSGIGQIEVYARDEKVKTCKTGDTCTAKVGPFNSGTYKYYAKAIDKSAQANANQSEEKTITVEGNGANATLPVTIEATLQQKEGALATKINKLSGPQSDIVELVYDWRVNNQSIALVNAPLDVRLTDDDRVVKNYTAYPNNGKIEDSSTAPGWTKKGKKGGAFVFDGNDDYIRFSSSDPDSINTKKKDTTALKTFTIETWVKVKPDGWGNPWAALVSKPFSASSWSDPWAVFKLSRFSDTDKLNFQITAGKDEAFSIQSKKNIPSDTWTHIVGTYDGKDLKLYINGELDNVQQVGKELMGNPDTDIYIGKKADTSESPEQFKGAMDEVRVLQMALSHNQVRNNYQLKYDQKSLDNTKADQQWQVAVSANDTKNYSDPTITNAVTPGEVGVRTEDTTSPKIEVSTTPSKPDDTQEISFSVSAKDTSSIKKIEIYINEKLEKTCRNKADCKINRGPFTAGELTYKAVAVDNSEASNKKSTDEKAVTISNKEVTGYNNWPTISKPKLTQSSQQLHLDVSELKDEDGDSVYTNIDWRVNGNSISLVNYSFDVKDSLVKDFTSYHNHGKQTKESFKPAWSAKGKKSATYYFDGNDDHIFTPPSDKMESLKEFTVELWIKHDDWGDNWATLVSKPFYQSKWEDPWSLFRLGRDGARDQLNFQITVDKEKVVNVQSKSDIPGDEWVHVAGTYDGTDLKIYVNGQLDNKMKVDAPLVQNRKTGLYLGTKWGKEKNNEAYKGFMDEFRLFNRALTPIQIKNHYLTNYGDFSVGETSKGQKWSASVTPTDTKEYGKSQTSNTVTIEQGNTENKEEDKLTLAQNYPNPFRSKTNIEYNLPDKNVEVSLTIYDLLGQKITKLVRNESQSGSQNITFDASALGISSGIYFYQLRVGDKTLSKKMTYIK